MNDCLKTLNIKDFLIFSKRQSASQNVERRHKSSIIVHPSLDVGHGVEACP